LRVLGDVLARVHAIAQATSRRGDELGVPSDDSAQGRSAREHVFPWRQAMRRNGGQ
jgi:hypothetical protein